MPRILLGNSRWLELGWMSTPSPAHCPLTSNLSWSMMAGNRMADGTFLTGYCAGALRQNTGPFHSSDEVVRGVAKMGHLAMLAKDHC